jgi:Tol biopolymer transport system component
MATERFGGQELMITGGDFTRQVRVTLAENTFEVEPKWSPDGHALAYSGKMTIGDDGELVADKKGRPLGTYDIYLIPSSGFDWDETTERPVRPINLTQTDDRDERSPSWRPF